MKVSKKEFLFIFLKELLIKILTFDYWFVKKIIKKEFRLERKEKILDIGCGTGTLTPLFSSQHYLGVDINPQLIAFAKKNYQQQFKVMDATNLRLPANSFDQAVIIGVLHHLSDKNFEKACQQMKKVLKKNGQALIIEAIPSLYRFNLLNRLFRSLDAGKEIRVLKDYQKTFSKYFKISKSYPQPGGLFDYAVLLLKNN